MNFKYIIFVSFLSIINFINGQTNEPVYEYLYDDYITNNDGLINGRSYINQILTFKKNHLFYENPEFITGEVVYNQQPYKAKFKYDILNDLLITQFIDNGRKYAFSLTPELIDEFTLNTHNFIKLLPNKNLNSVYKNGLFEVAYKGKNITYYIKHLKKEQDVLSGDMVRYKFPKFNYHILKVDGKYYKVSKKRDFIKILPYLKKEISSFFYHKKINRTSILNFLTHVDSKIISNE